jgi:hypothetical protein
MKKRNFMFMFEEFSLWQELLLELECPLKSFVGV